jgi:hypothetical protein
MTNRGLIAFLLWLLIGNVCAHELEANRLTLVLRERNHLSLTFFVNYTDALYRALAAQRTFQEFVLIYSAMPPQEFQKELLRAQLKFQTTTRLSLSTGQEVLAKKWIWPDPAKVQRMLQERAMQAMVAPEQHTHETALEIRAELTSERDISALKISLPDEFQSVLVVSYQPRQIWVAPKTRSTIIKF